jgi:hypothetical protein
VDFSPFFRNDERLERLVMGDDGREGATRFLYHHCVSRISWRLFSCVTCAIFRQFRISTISFLRKKCVIQRQQKGRRTDPCLRGQTTDLPDASQTSATSQSQQRTDTQKKQVVVPTSTNKKKQQTKQTLILL